ncbi:uncharacterized protein [Physcomitrium patens]|uniref:Uncharacterized protein n=1 Tax=Physcomitrium patens TaxID=3218 RepID=A0A2K1KFS8_PHYPA|nr:uncharacterized protein LOC112283857 isoform X1 [Physcomitrium patens]PNR52640.1 hypothetical protein PHYPA_009014 [Physcomitrium patens]|eukprot:XP_024378887.1 uncharacterized protein LOC112283857 isoform X1 [Physcomitrella patens]
MKMRRLRERIGGALGLGLLMVLVWVTIWWNQGIVYEDVLPVLPHSVAWPILKKTRSAVDLLPRFVGGVASENVNVMWKGACFYQNEAHLEYVEASGEGKREGLVLHIKTSKAHSYTCLDLYVFATPYRVTWDYYFLARNHTLSIKELEEGELEYIKKNGISVFLMPAGMLGTLVALYDALPIFFNSEWGENANIAFLKKHMGAQFIKRSDPWVTNVTTDDIQSGDFLALSKIRGRWGGFETLEKWVSGSYSGHTAVCLRDDDGKLWVGESGHENEKGEEVIVVLPWDEWWVAQVKDPANAHVALLPLHADMRAKFNNTRAWDYALHMNGKPYGYHNMIFSWIDTPNANYPAPLDCNLVASAITVWTRLQPDYASNMWNEALNKRLGTKGLDLPGVMVETERQGIPFEELLAIPEKDNWKYSDGYSTSCVAFVLEIYKQAGLFGSVADSVQVTEFTVRDAYMLKFYEDDKSRLPAWCGTSNTSRTYCQILGEYDMELPGYNTIEPYANMNERCPSLPPSYDRPAQC